MKHFTLKIKQLFAAMMMLACIPASAQFKATVEQYAKSDYTTTAAEFKLSEIATTLGTDTATLVAALDVWATDTVDVPEMFFLKVGEELTDNYTQGSQGGFWIARSGAVGSWGVDAVYYNQIWWDNEDNADKWSVVASYLELLAEPEFAEHEVVQSGEFFGSDETIAYVGKVMHLYNIYSNRWYCPK